MHGTRTYWKSLYIQYILYVHCSIYCSQRRMFHHRTYIYEKAATSVAKPELACYIKNSCCLRTSAFNDIFNGTNRSKHLFDVCCWLQRQQLKFYNQQQCNKDIQRRLQCCLNIP